MKTDLDTFEKALWATIEQHAPHLEPGYALMALGIVCGKAAKLIDTQGKAADHEGLDVINSVAHQTYDAAIIG